MIQAMVAVMLLLELLVVVVGIVEPYKIGWNEPSEPFAMYCR